MSVNRFSVYIVSVIERKFFPNSGVVKSYKVLKLCWFKNESRAKACWERFREDYKGKRVDFNNNACFYTRFNDVDVNHNQKENWVYPTKEWEVRMKSVTP